MDKLYIEQLGYKVRIEKFTGNVKKQAVNKRTVTFYATRIEALDIIFNNAHVNHLKMMQEKDADKHVYFVEEFFDQIEELHLDTKTELKELLLALNPPPVINAVVPNENVNNTPRAVKLPCSDLPKFSGDYNKWISFKDRFLSIIKNAGAVSEITKLDFLLSNLEGEALKLVESYQVNEDNYTVVWNVLEKRFENKKLLVNAQLQILFNQKPVKQESAQAIKGLLDTTNQCIENLKNLNVDVSGWDPLLIFMITERMPAETFSLWEQNNTSTSELPKFESLAEFLESRFHVVERISQGASRFKDTAKNGSEKANEQMVQNYHVQSKASCRLCNGSHPLRFCMKFKRMSVPERLKFVSKNQLCFNCLAQSHLRINCTSKSKCNTCDKNHHTLLHVIENKVKVENNVVTPPSTLSPLSPEFESQAHFATKSSQVLLATAQLNIVCQNGKTFVVRALIDPGSQTTFVTENVVQRCRLQKMPTCAIITGLGRTETGRSCSMAKISLQSKINLSMVVHTEAVIMKSLTSTLPPCKLPSLNLKVFKNLSLADSSFDTPEKIDLILGADIYPEIILEGILKLENGIIAQNTIFGWIITGPTVKKNTSIVSMFNSLELDCMLRKFWEIEEGSSDIPMCNDDQTCEQFFKDTHTRKNAGQYCVRLPFKNPHGPNLGVSRKIAEKRLINLETRFSKNPKLKSDYISCFEEYITLGHMNKVPSELATQTPNYFIPHHAVVKEVCGVSKFRIVFDASCKTSNGVSLNDEMFTGPRLQEDLIAVLLRWSVTKFVLCTDIVKMYRQILVDQQDTKFQRVLWRKDTSKPIEVFEINRVTFGTSSAPYLALRTIQQLASDEEGNFPNAAKVLRSNVYVDDIMMGDQTVGGLLDKRNEVIEMLESGGFKLKKWASNTPEVLKEIPVDDLSFQFTPQNKDDVIKMLGILWSPINDDFTFKVAEIQQFKKITKRQILSIVARFYDPLGWASPVIISAKIFIQKLWCEKAGWDDAIAHTLLNWWNDFTTKLHILEKLKIPRWIGWSDLVTGIEIHGFSDASEKAYGAVVYSKTTNGKGEVHIKILMSKTKVAPQKTVTLPRLELCGAHLLAKLINKILSMNLVKWDHVFGWTDSQITLAWIKSSPNKWKTFIATRVSEIQRLVGPNSWRYVPTKENPADCCTRGLTPSELLDHKLWWNGPPWLKLNNDSWPTMNIPHHDLEQRKIQVFTTQNQEIIGHDIITKYSSLIGKDIISRISNLQRLLRVTVYCRRFISNSRSTQGPKLDGTNPRKCNPVKVEEIHEAQEFWIKTTQNMAFHQEIDLLKKEKSQLQKNNPDCEEYLPTTSTIYSLRPFLDEKDILRVGGRLKNSKFPFSERHPIIIPHHSQLTSLIIDDSHIKTLHGGLAQTLAHIRRQFWIVRAKNAVKSAIQKCITCFRFKKENRIQLMGNLPEYRLQISPPFTNVGIDFAGPIQTRPAKIRGKAAVTLKSYIAVFVCMSTRAMHIELVSELSTNAFLAALSRFTSRRGLCSNIFSDCGTNFEGANNVLQENVNAFLSENTDLLTNLATQNIKWNFIPPGAPHFGGIWEAGVKSVKGHLRRILGSHILTFEEVSTILAKIESSLNSRPLCPMTENPDDLEVLTPGHFLILRAPLAPPQPDLTDVKISTLNRWQHIEKLHQDFWNIWRSEHLSRLQQRPKWLKTQPNIKVGQLVLVKDERLPPLTWNMGRIMEIHPGNDGLVRVATLKTRNSVITRPITKLCVLPLENPHINPSEP